MTEDLSTALDRAHAAMELDPGNDAARLRFYERVADAELFLMLAEEPEGDDPVRPALFALEEGRVVLAFDTEERLAAFADAPTPYAALPGRVIVRMLAGAGDALGLGLNLAVAPSSFLMPAEAVAWLAQTLDAGPEALQARPQVFAAPGALPEALLPALDAKLSMAAGFAKAAVLAAVTYSDGRRGHMLAFLGTRPGAEDALARAVGEALRFSGIEAGEIDVTFLPEDSAAAGRISAVGLRFDLPEPAVEPAPRAAPAAPGSDPARPPILR